LGYDLLEGSLWLDVRKKQDARRGFGAPSAAAWTAFRKTMPLAQTAGAGAAPVATTVTGFLRSTPASTFYRGAEGPKLQ